MLKPNPPPLSNGQHRHITIICDGQSALDTIEISLKMNKVKNKHSDLISLATAIWDSSNYKFTKKHVKAYQDDLQRPLTINETLNYKMDDLVKNIIRTHIHSNQDINFSPTSLEFGTVRCNGVIIGSSLQQSLYHSILHSKLGSRLSIFRKISEPILYNIIHWRVLEMSRKEDRLATKIFISK